MRYKTIYLTGAPASGKSTTATRLAEIKQPLEVWEYGARLTAFIQQRDRDLEDQADLRGISGLIVGPEDIGAVDALLLNFVAKNRHARHIIVDSHPVTKEKYGFRVTAFSPEQLRKLDPDEIWVLYTDPQTAVERISNQSQGRPLVSIEDARTHTALQMSVATAYGILAGRPVYLFDTDRAFEEVVGVLAARLG